MASCPNKNDKDWIKLVDNIGEFNAYKAFVLNNDQIPSSEEIDSIITKYNDKFRLLNFNDKVQDLKKMFNVGEFFKTDLLAKERAKGINKWLSEKRPDIFEEFYASSSKNKLGNNIVTFIPTNKGRSIYLQKSPIINEYKIKEGVNEIFKSNIKLNKIGTIEEYSKYIDTIFPYSNVKDILYHGSPNKFEKFDKSFIGTTWGTHFGEGFYFSKYKEEAIMYMKSFYDLDDKYESFKIASNSIISVIINSNKIASTEELSPEEFKNLIKTNKVDTAIIEGGKEYVVFNPEQIHILGSNQDVEGFKKFVNNINKFKEYQTNINLFHSNKKIDIFKKSLGIDIDIIEDPTIDDIGAIKEINGSKVIVVNPILMTSDTIGHEFGHILIDLIGGLNNPLVKSARNSLIGSNIEKQVIDAYPELVQLNDSRIDKEILAQAIGLETVKIFKDIDSQNKWYNILIRLFERIKRILGIEKSDVKKLSKILFTEGYVKDADMSLVGKEYQQKSNLQKLAEYKDKIKDNLLTKISIYQNSGKVETVSHIKNTFDIINNLDAQESIIYFIDFADRQVNSIYKRYENTYNEYKFENKKPSIESIRRWVDYVSPFKVLSDFKVFLSNAKKDGFKITKEDGSEYDLSIIADKINSINDKILEIEKFFSEFGLKYLTNFLKGLSSRITIEYKELYEKEYNKKSDDFKKSTSVNDYINQQLELEKDTIEQKTEQLIESELKKASSDISYLQRMLETPLDSGDVIVSAMVKAIVIKDREARLDFIDNKKKLVDALRELEEIVPNNMFSDVSKAYDFMLEKDSKGNKTGYIVSKFSSEMMSGWYDVVKRTESLDELDKISKRSNWKQENAPRNKKEYNEALDKKLQSLVDSKVLSNEELREFYINESRQYSQRFNISDIVNQEASEEIIRWKIDNSWTYNYPTKKWENKDFKKLNELPDSDPRKKFYNLIIDILHDSDSMLPSRYKLRYKLPSIPKDISERIKSGQSLSHILKETTSLGLIKREEDIEKGREEMTSESGKKIRFLPVFYTNKIDVEDQSFDVATIVLMRSQNALDYYYKNQIIPEIELTRDFLNSRKVSETDASGNVITRFINRKITDPLTERDLTKSGANSLILAQFEDFISSNVYGIKQVNEGDIKIGNLYIDKAKAANLLGKGTAYNLLALNPVQGVSNVLLGEGMQAVEAFGSDRFDIKSLTKASNKYFSNILDTLNDVGSRYPKSIISLLNDRFDVLNDNSIESLRHGSKFRSLMNSSALFFMAHVGEHFMQTRVMLAMLDKVYAYDKDGKKIGSMLDFVKSKNGEIIFEGVDLEKSKFTKQDQILFGEKVKRVLSELHGEYSSLGASALQRYALGRLVIMFRKFIVPGVRRRFGKKRENEFLEDYQEGNYRFTANFMGKLIRESKLLSFAIKSDKDINSKITISEQWNSLTRREKALLKKTIGEIGYFTVILILSLLLINIGDDEDDYSKSKSYYFMAYQLTRLRQELSFYVLPSSFMSILKSPMASTSVLENIGDVLVELVPPYERYEKGYWKDDLKIKKEFIDLLPVIKQLYRIDNMKDQMVYFNR